MKAQGIRLKYCVRKPIRNGIGVAAENDDPLWPRYVRITDIAGPRTLRDNTFMSLPPDQAAEAPLEVSDILAAAVGATYGKTYLHTKDIGAAAYAGYLVRISMKHSFDPRYVAYWTESNHYWDQVNTSVVQSTIQNFSASKYGELRLPVPALDLQSVIADYLDRETAKLDVLIATKERLLRLMAEKHRATFTNAVTHGLDPNALLRDSGIPWLGEIPAHWKIIALRFLVDFTSGATPETGRAEYWNGEIPWVSPKDMKYQEIADAQDHVSELALSESMLRLIDPGAVLIVVRGMILAHSFPTAVNAKPVTINQDMKALRCQRILDPYYLRDFFRGNENYIVSLADSSAHGTRKLETAILGRLEVLLPPLTEQRDIVKHIASETTKLDTLRAATERTITLLKERRAALITASVTGQINVRGVP